LGITDGTDNAGAYYYTHQGVDVLSIAQENYGTNIGQATAGTTRLAQDTTIGLTEDPNNSGIVASLSDSSVDLRVMVQLANGYLDDAVETCRTVKEHSVIEFQMPTSTNSYTWYRKYSDGWCEQGGICATTTSLIYPVTMADTNYTIFLQPRETVGKYAMNARTLTTTGATIDTDAPEWHNYSWRIEGMYTTGE
jgi:hypothetical protein